MAGDPACIRLENTMTISHILRCVAVLGGCTLTGCVAVPTGPHGEYVFVPLPTMPPHGQPGWPGPSSLPAVLQARLYPANNIAAQTGVVSGTVTNLMNGKGRFQLGYAGEILIGEATRVDGDARRGVASAYSANGSFMTCEYQMSTPRQGAGTCSFSNGAQYKVHIGV
jgi:hypothetical protein